MKNRWKASVKNEEISTEETPPKNNSKKIGIAMGIVGALLVTAGVAPMFFGGDNLEGDLTAQNQAEEVDPLVALLSGGNTEMNTSPTPITSAVAVPPASSSSAKPSATPKTTITSTPKPVVSQSSTGKLAEVDKILVEEGEAIKENPNTGKDDKSGSAFGKAEELHSAAGLSNTSTTKPSASTNQPTPTKTVQTGNNTSLVLGFLFLILSGIISFRGFLRRRS